MQSMCFRYTMYLIDWGCADLHSRAQLENESCEYESESIHLSMRETQRALESE